MSDRSDLGDRLGRALAAGGDDVDASGLAAGARRRATVRRRTRSRVVVGAVVLAVVAAVVPLALLRVGGDVGPTVTQRSEQDDGWRTVTRDGLTFEVPDTWGDDVFAQLCPPAADCLYVPPTVITDVLPGAKDSYLAPRRSNSDDGGWVTSAVIDGVDLFVVAPSRAVAQRVMDSAYGGCAPRSTVSSRKTEQPALAEASATTGATLCRYTGEGGQVRLDATERLDPEGATRLLEAMWQAPELHQMIVDCVASVPYDATRVRLGDAEVWINDSSPCSAQMGIIDGVDVREVTPEVRAALDPDGWQTVDVAGVTLDFPGDWVRLDTGACRAAAVRFGPADTDPCAVTATLTLTPFRNVPIDGPPGLDAGFVLTGDQMVSVVTEDPEVTRRVLASARVQGDATAGLGDLAAPWVEQEYDGATWRQPVGADIRVRTDHSASCEIGNPQNPAFPDDGDRWRAEHCADRIVVVTGPTRALTDLVTSTVVDEPVDVPSGTDPWRTVTADGVLLDVPAEWVRLDISTCSQLVVDPEGARFGPVGTAPCARAVPVEVFGTDSLLAGALRQPGFSGPVGVAFSEGVVVTARGDLETRRRVLGSVRRPGEDPGDLAVPWVDVTRDGATWQQPDGADVEVSLLGADVRCRDVDYAATTPTDDGRWRGTYCLDRGATVTAPTEALADMVGSTVRSDVQ